MFRIGLAATVFCSCIVGPLVPGCGPDPSKVNMEPIERTTQTFITDVVKPAVEKCSTELSQRTAQLQGQGSLINPGYHVGGFASFGPTVLYSFDINAVGVSANLAGATQADAGQPGVVPLPRPTQPTEPTEPPK